jgi:hypothetical protein
VRDKEGPALRSQMRAEYILIINICYIPAWSLKLTTKNKKPIVIARAILRAHI